MGSIIQKLADEIKLHGSYENYCGWRDAQERSIILHEFETEPEPDFLNDISIKSVRFADLVTKPYNEIP